MGDQINNYDINSYNGSGNPYHQQFAMMYHPNMQMNQFIPPNGHPSAYSPGPNYNQQHSQHMQSNQGNIMNQPNHMMYMQQQSQQQQNQSQGNLTNMASMNSIDGISQRIPQSQHDGQVQQNMNVRINHGVASYPHLAQSNHLPQQQQNSHMNSNSGSHAIINNSPPPLNQSQKSRQQKQLYQSGSAQHNQQNQQNQILENQQVNEDNQEVLSHMSNNNNSLNGNKPLLEHLELSHFKVEQCQNSNAHNHKQCKYYHTIKDKRRVGVHYSSDPCQDPANCQLGNNCPKAHNKVEELYCPDKYKTKFCTCYPNNCHNCEYGNYCSFAHTEHDIKIDLIDNYVCDEDFYVFYYKTVWCPFNFIKHDKASCVYSHNWQDYRRRPQDYNYEPVSCQNWKPANYITKYEEGCPNKFDCNKCHGWKESEYHPRNYRTKQCTQTTNNEKCNKGPQCPYYHNAQEKRNIPQNIQESLFKYCPRNRNIRGTYKQQTGQTPNDSQPFPQARINQLNSTQSLPDHHSNIPNYTGTSAPPKHSQPQCQSPTIVHQEQQIIPSNHNNNSNGNNSQMMNGRPIMSIQSKKPIKLKTTPQLETNNRNQMMVNKGNLNSDETAFFEMSTLNEEQQETILGLTQDLQSGSQWGPSNGSQNHISKQQQGFQIYQTKQQQPVMINNTKSFDNFNINEFGNSNNNSQYFQNPQSTFHTNNMVQGGQINPEISDLTQQVGQFSLHTYDNSGADFI